MLFLLSKSVDFVNLRARVKRGTEGGSGKNGKTRKNGFWSYILLTGVLLYIYMNVLGKLMHIIS